MHMLVKQYIDSDKVGVTNGEVDLDGGDKTDGERADEYVCNDAVVGERQTYAADVFFVTVRVQHRTGEKRTGARTHTRCQLSHTRLKFILTSYRNVNSELDVRCRKSHIASLHVINSCFAKIFNIKWKIVIYAR